MPRAEAALAFAVAGLLGICGKLAFAHHAAVDQVPATASAETSKALAAQPPRAAELPAVASYGTFPALPLRFSNQNTQQVEDITLYDSTGHVNESAAARLDALLCDTRDPKAWATLELDRRTLQLAVRAALHFHASEVQVISAYRKPGRRREGLHASGRAIDFKLPNVPARALAAYLRTLSRVGVGVYTHPKTSYVHLDDREQSYYWLDASPPGRTWRELAIRDAALPKRDASYVRANDWPEGTSAPLDSAR